MSKNVLCRVLALSAAVSLLLSACRPEEKNTGIQAEKDVLTWTTWTEYNSFLALANKTYPDIQLEFTNYAGVNRTGYSWMQMRADDIPDIFITSQVLDEDLAKERLTDLSGYAFVNDFPTSILDQVSVDGGIYLLPVSNAVYGIYYNKTLMEEHGWTVPSNFAELEALCGEIREAGLIPGIIGTELTGNTFSAVFNLAKTSWLTTPEGANWERDFLAGNATAAGMWEGTMEYVQKYVDLGMFTTDPEDRHNATLIQDYLGGRKAVFCTSVYLSKITEFSDTGDKLGLMPYIGEDGSKNVYMYNPASYIGISRKLTQPGNEKKLENAVNLLSLLYSPEGQATFITDQTPCVLSVLDTGQVSAEAILYDAWKAQSEGRVFPMTYVRWQNILSDVGQAFKEWFRGENEMNGPRCIARMDELQSSYLNSQEEVYFCESTDDFTFEETAQLLGMALGSAAGADAVLIPYLEGDEDGAELENGVTGRLYQDKINMDVVNAVMPDSGGEYVLMTMTGSQVNELAASGFVLEGMEEPFPYALVTKEGQELEKDTLYQVAFLAGSYTDEAGQAYNARTEKGMVRDFLRIWLEEHKRVSPGENLWK